MKRFPLLFPLLLILFTALLFVWWKTASAPANPNEDKPRDFLITRGQTAEEIGTKLAQQGLIKSPVAFKLYTQITGKQKGIQAGEYRLSPNLTLQELVLALTRGPQELWVTYPEGFRREEIAAKTIQVLGLEGAEADAFWFAFLKETAGKEGFLFPDTYLFARDVTAATAASKLRSTFDARVTGEMLEDAQATGLSMDEILVLASIVERETLTQEERPIVAGVLLKRLQAGWPLQADATLQYILATQSCPLSVVQLDCKWWNIPTAEHRQSLKSAYNTYLNPGLPPGPIANPGLTSIKAVIYSEESPYWFYLHDPQGNIHYAETIEEHNENINRYLR